MDITEIKNHEEASKREADYWLGRAEEARARQFGQADLEDAERAFRVQVALGRAFGALGRYLIQMEKAEGEMAHSKASGPYRMEVWQRLMDSEGMESARKEAQVTLDSVRELLDD